ncbi:hypothetical protein SAY86_019323 [Trapa natans]|uniref:BAHD acyltransferase n=1 Tax=Trapa natans TaxID=22666 RepID=A0AAN7LMZ7_TRANT|nr:hypothetical protein SAY86_019323 [Trapa natans]
MKEMEVKVEIIKRETILPSSPIPAELKTFKLSLLDQISPAVYTPLLLFYTNHGHQLTPDQLSRRLKLSMSKTLTHFYPFTGRVIDNMFIECNDQGAVFVEAKVGGCLSDILKEPDMAILDKLIPIDISSNEARDGPLLLVQANFFDCGGLVVGICISHKQADAATLCTFVNTWAGEARGMDSIVSPDFCLSKKFPPMDFLSALPEVELPKKANITKRLVVEPSRIAELKVRAASDDVPRPTAVEAVTALVWKAAASASRKNADPGSAPRKTGMSQIVNLRKRVDPPIPENTMGNLVSYFRVETEDADAELKLPELVCLLRKGLKKYQGEINETLGDEVRVPNILKAAADLGAHLADEEVNNFNCSSWCKFPLYEADFGWGKPAWASLASLQFKNDMTMINTLDGKGIEVWVAVSDADTDLFEHDDELLQFASLNPSIKV